MTEPPAATSRIAWRSWSTSETRSFSRYARPSEPCFEQRQRVRRFDVLAEHDDADVGMAGAELVRGAHALVGPGRRHPDVGEHDVGRVGGDGREQRVEVLARADDLDVVLRREQPGDALAHEVVVLGHQHPDRHRTQATRRPASGRLSPCRRPESCTSAPGARVVCDRITSRRECR